MARVKYVEHSRDERTCERCGDTIPKGGGYRSFKVGFRSRFKHVRCMKPECSPRQSEMTASKMAGVYAAIEGAEDELAALEQGGPEEDASNVTSALDTAAEGIEEVAQEYREANAASPTGYVFGEDLNERADEISSAADELQGWQPSADEPDYDSCDNEDHEEPDEGEDREVVERGTNCDSCAEIAGEWWATVIDEARTALGEVSL